MTASEILLVEDNVVLNFEITESLHNFHYRTTSVYCGEAALEALNRRQYLAGLVTDIELGVGPDGFSIAYRARALYPGLPVVFISGAGAAERRARGVAGSVFIGKPLHPHQIVAALAQLIPREAA